MKKIICAVLAAVIALCSTFAATAAVTDIAAEAAEAAIIATGEEANPDIPDITSILPVKGGLKLSFTGYEGAYAYRVFIRRDDNSGWKKVGDTTALTYTHQNLIAYKEYLYTVRALDRNGNFISGFNKNGHSYTYLPDPVLVSASNALTGPKVTWKAVDGAKNYRIYVKTPTNTEWTRIGDTDKTSFTYTAAVSGTTYTFTVRVYDKENKTPLSYYDRSGVKTAYVAAPAVTAFSPVEGGTKVKWSAVKGAYKYRLFIRRADDSGWKKVGDTTGLEYSHTGLTANTEYKYTVRCLDSYGNFISAYNSAGWVYRYILPPTMKTAESGEGTLTLKWESSAYAASYRIYRREFGKDWAAVGTSKTASFTDKTYQADTVYTYTVRCLNENGVLISYFYRDNPYYCNGALANGKLQAGGKTINFENGHVRQGFITVNGKTYYYDANGTLVKNGIAGSEKEGYKYADKNGVIDNTACLALEYKGSKWNAVNGKVTRVSTEKDLTLHRALKIASSVTNSSMTKSQKLRAVWNHLTTAYGECSRPDYFDMSWVERYANDIFVNGKGNCFSYAAAFAYLAKAVGYTECYGCSTGGHGWTEIGGLIYDPEWSMHSNKYSYYGMSYDDKCDVPYKSALSIGAEWKRIKV